MRTFFWTLCLLAMGLGSRAQTNTFTLSGQIEGLCVGDTLVLEEVILPLWEMRPVATIVVSQPGRFGYTGTQSGARPYLLSYRAADRKPYLTASRGLGLFLAEGETSLQDSLRYLYSAHKTGGVYDDPLVSRYDALEMADSRKRSEIYVQAFEARQRGDTAATRRWEEAYQQVRPSEEMKRIADSLALRVDDSQYGAYLYAIYQLNDIPPAQSRERFERYTPDVKSSYIGQLIEKTIRDLERIAVGSPAPAFTLTDKTGTSRSLSDYAGKYLVIYHWGLCGGTIQVDPLVNRLYDDFHNRGLEILGWTQEDLAPKFAENPLWEEVFGPMARHRWPTVYTDQAENTYIKELYYLLGIPYFYLIGPDGRILITGYHQTEEIRKILETSL